MGESQKQAGESQITSGNTNPRLILVLGGARSGKSTFAEKLAASSNRRVAFIATATASDVDMRERINRHQQARPGDWQTIEEPLYIAEAVQQAATRADVILLDCMTLWLGNWFGTQGGLDGELEETTILREAYTSGVLKDIEELLATVSRLETGKTLIIVSNEVGLGIVPAYPLGRMYRDILGWVNQRLARDAERVYLLIAGLAVDIKKLHAEATLFD